MRDEVAMLEAVESSVTDSTALPASKNLRVMISDQQFSLTTWCTEMTKLRFELLNGDIPARRCGGNA